MVDVQTCEVRERVVFEHMAATLKYSLVSGFLAKINEPLKQSE
jgi:hypothetical protein